MKNTKLMFGALLAALIIGGPTQASVLVSYTLTFTGSSPSDQGSGTLVLNLPSFPDNQTISFTSLPNSIFSSFSGTIGGVSFNLTDLNISGGGVQGTGSSSIDVAITESTAGLSKGTAFLQINNGAANAGNFEIHEFNASDLGSGTYTIGAPFMAPVPEPSTWAMMILGLLAVGLIGYRRKRQLHLA
jgi:PEP-CTERM motif